MSPSITNSTNRSLSRSSFEEQKSSTPLGTGAIDLGFNNEMRIDKAPITNINEYEAILREIPAKDKKATREKLGYVIGNMNNDEIITIMTELLSLLVRFKYQRTFSTNEAKINETITNINNSIDKLNGSLNNCNLPMDNTQIKFTSKEIFELAKNTSSSWNFLAKKAIPSTLTSMLQQFGTSTYEYNGRLYPGKLKMLNLTPDECDWLNSEIGNPTIEYGTFYSVAYDYKLLQAQHLKVNLKMQNFCHSVIATKIPNNCNSVEQISQLENFIKNELQNCNDNIELCHSKVYTIQLVIKMTESSTLSLNNLVDSKNYHKINFDLLNKLSNHKVALKIICQKRKNPALKDTIMEFKKMLAGYILTYNLSRMTKNFNTHLARKIESEEYKEEYNENHTVLTRYTKGNDKKEFIHYQNQNERWEHIAVPHEGEQGVIKLDKTKAPSGKDKTLSVKNEITVVLEKNKKEQEDKAVFTGVEIRKIFGKLGIKRFSAAIKNGQRFFDGNAGPNLWENHKNKGKPEYIKIVFTDFFPILLELDKLIKYAYYQTDIKPENIGVKKGKDRATILTVFDNDDLTTNNTPHWTATKKFTCFKLLNEFESTAEEINRFSAESHDTRELEELEKLEKLQKATGQVLCERPTAVTMLQILAGYNTKEDWAGNYGYYRDQVQVHTKNKESINQFCQTHIKPEYHKHFTSLVVEPIEYRNKLHNGEIENVSLLEMFQGSDEFIQEMEQQQLTPRQQPAHRNDTLETKNDDDNYESKNDDGDYETKSNFYNYKRNSSFSSIDIKNI